MGCLNEEEFAVVEEMSKRGGSFVKALAECFHHADHTNKLILKKAFSHYWDEYQPSKWDNNLAEQADQDLKESKFSSDAYLQ
jgi:pyruvate/2-oxoacid:ferredoxin oxidoreductase beta subunit